MGLLDMNEYPCKECILLGNCSQTCYRLKFDWFEIEKHIRDKNNCPDCGGTEGIKFNDGYMSIIECCGCNSSFYPTHANIIRYRKYRKVKDFNIISTTFKHYIEHHVLEYRVGVST